MLPNQTDVLDAAFLIPVTKLAQSQVTKKELQFFQCLLKVPFFNREFEKFFTCLPDNLITQKSEEAIKGTYTIDLILTNKEKLVSEINKSYKNIKKKR